MKHQYLFQQIVGLGMLAALASQAFAEETPAKPPRQGLLLLHNGQILEGTISQTAGQYVVDVSCGQIRVKETEVDTVCASIQDAYQHKRTAMQQGNASQHLELASWCLRYKLLDSAVEEIDMLAKVDPNNPMINALRHRLELAKESPRMDDTDSQAASPLLTNEALDRMVRSLPRGSIETFTQSVQPVLMNHCMSVGCHGSQAENGLQLYRTSVGKTASRRLVQRNLYSLLQYVDRENPSESRLIKAISGPHGSLQNPVLSERQSAQYQRIVEWVHQVAGQSDFGTPTTVAPWSMPENSKLALQPKPSAVQPRMLPQNLRKASPLHATGKDPAEPSGNAQTPSSQKSPSEVSPVAHTQPADPFDPEAFNNLQEAKQP